MEIPPECECVCISHDELQTHLHATLELDAKSYHSTGLRDDQCLARANPDMCRKISRNQTKLPRGMLLGVGTDIQEGIVRLYKASAVPAEIGNRQIGLSHNS